MVVSTVFSAHAVTATQTPEEKPIEITVSADGSVYYGSEPVDRGKARQYFINWAQRSPQPTIHTRADEQVPYRFVAEMVADIKYAGLTHIGLVSK